jgi:hypothetical protein
MESKLPNPLFVKLLADTQEHQCALMQAICALTENVIGDELAGSLDDLRGYLLALRDFVGRAKGDASVSLEPAREMLFNLVSEFEHCETLLGSAPRDGGKNRETPR